MVGFSGWFWGLSVYSVGFFRFLFFIWEIVMVVVLTGLESFEEDVVVIF